MQTLPGIVEQSEVVPQVTTRKYVYKHNNKQEMTLQFLWYTEIKIYLHHIFFLLNKILQVHSHPHRYFCLASDRFFLQFWEILCTESCF